MAKKKVKAKRLTKIDRLYAAAIEMLEKQQLTIADQQSQIRRLERDGAEAGRSYTMIKKDISNLEEKFKLLKGDIYGVSVALESVDFETMNTQTLQRAIGFAQGKISSMLQLSGGGKNLFCFHKGDQVDTYDTMRGRY